MHRFGLAVVLLGVATAASAQPGVVPRVSADTLARSQEWAQVLAQDLDQLREAVRQEVRGPEARRDLQRHIEGLLGDVLILQRMLQPGITAGVLAKRYQQVDRQLEALRAELNRVPGQHFAVALAARRLRASDARLHQLLAQLGAGGGPVPATSIARQARVFELAVRDLDAVLRAAVPPGEPAGRLHQRTQHLLESLQAFHPRAAASTGFDLLRKEYLPVHRAWDRLDLALYQSGLNTNAPVRARWLRARTHEEAIAAALRIDELVAANVFDRLQGRWALITISSNGVPQDLSVFGKQYFVFKGDTWQITEGGQVISRAKFKLVDVDGPIKKMDSFVVRGSDRGEKVEAILRFRGPLLYYAPGQVRPTDFGQNYYTVWRKVD
jgi:uncharacterized protein (TIGR03067 family)